jgi:hypothetical protein
VPRHLRAFNADGAARTAKSPGDARAARWRAPRTNRATSEFGDDRGATPERRLSTLGRRGIGSVAAMTKETATRIAAGIAVVSAAVVVASLTLARQVDPWFLSGVGLLIVLLPAHALFVRIAERAAAKARLAETWGREDDRPRDPSALRRLFVMCEGPARSPAALDDATWDDLDMDAVFERVDRTLSTPGEYALYEILRTPQLDPSPLAARERAIETLGRDDAVRVALRSELDRLGRRSVDAMARLLWGKGPVGRPNRALLIAQGWLPPVGAAWIVLGGGGPAVALTIGAVVFNVYTHFSRKNEILSHADALRYMAALVRTGSRLAAVKPTEAESGVAPILDEIGRVSREARVIARDGARLAWSEQPAGFDLPQAVLEYASIFFLFEVRGYYAVLRHLDSHVEDLRRLFRLVGELDALQSVASYRAGLPAFCRPEFAPGAAALRVEDVVHPLVADAVPNSFELARRSAVVTGSNMSGKSTFLRTLGIAVVFAQTIHTVLADSYRACPLRVASSVTIRDDVLSGRSFYLAEAERLLRLVRFAEAPGAALVLVDEPLRGTNSTERIAAVAEILTHLADVGALTVAATHELKIVQIVAARYDPYHFSDEVGAGNLVFPHRVLAGVATTRNAIRLLSRLGYPPDLVARAEARAAEFDARSSG